MSELKVELQFLKEPGPISRAEAEAFFDRHSLSEILEWDTSRKQARLLQEVPDLANDTAIALKKLLDTGACAEGLADYAAAGLGAGSPDLRRLSCRQLGRLTQLDLEEGLRSDRAEALVQQLVRMLADPDPAVAAAASDSLEDCAVSLTGLTLVLGADGQGRAIQDLARSSDPIVSLRTLSLVISLAAKSPEAAAAVRSGGLLEPLAAEVGNAQDMLGCAAALQLVVQLAQQSGPAAGVLLGAMLLPNLKALLSQEQPYLRCQALQALGALLAASAATGADDWYVDLASRQPLSRYVLTLLQSILADAEAEADLQEAALDVIGQVSASANGTELLMSQPGLPPEVAARALGTAGSSAPRVPALHALAGLLGALRAAEEPSSAVLGPQAEASLQDAVFEGSGSRTPAEAVWAFLSQPFQELRLATFRLIAALALHEWGARELASSGALLDHLTNPKSEVTQDGSHWRFACVQSLYKAAKRIHAEGSQGAHHDLLLEVVPELEAAMKQGPYGSGQYRPQPQVATEMR